jgi:hypothetical protein
MYSGVEANGFETEDDRDKHIMPYGEGNATMPNCILQPDRGKAKALAQKMGWAMQEAGEQTQFDLPEDWAREIVGCMEADLEPLADFAGGIRRSRSAGALKRRIESRGLLG